MADPKREIVLALLGQQGTPEPTAAETQSIGSLADLGDYFSPTNTTRAPWPVMAARSTLAALSAPGDAYSGALSMMDSNGRTSLGAIGRATDLAGLMTLGAGAVPSEGGTALNAGLNGLRERYAAYLREASGGKDPARIKLTPERIEAAKELKRTGFGSYPEGRPIDPIGSLPSPYRATEQARLATDFATQARQVANDVRVKFPEGPSGSVYVRVGDNGTVRFADHLPPIENGQVVGGYSKELGRRHQPATVDVSRGHYAPSINPAPAYDWLAALLKGDAI